MRVDEDARCYQFSLATISPFAMFAALPEALKNITIMPTAHCQNPREVFSSRLCLVVQVPTFLFYRGGKQTGRHVGSSRGDLMGQILQQQSALGIAPPPPPGTAQKRHTLRRR